MNHRHSPLFLSLAGLLLLKGIASCQSNQISPDSSAGTGASAGQGGANAAGQSGQTGASTAGQGGQGLAGVAGQAGASASAGSADSGGSGGSLAGAGGAAGSGEAGKSGAAGKEPLVACPAGAPGPAMVLIKTEEGNYCIDTTEVTQSQYAAFLASKPLQSAQSEAWCQKNNPSYEPKYQDDTGQGNCQPGAVDPESKGDWPMVCVDWCDAKAYCAWAGKRLCGSRQGGALKSTEDASSLESQWNYACTNGGTTKLAYGDQPDASKCPPLKIGSVKELSGCRGVIAPFDEIVGLAGNVDEWEDACDDVIHCAVRTNTGDKPCSQLNTASINDGSPGTGFRCCAD